MEQTTATRLTPAAATVLVAILQCGCSTFSAKPADKHREHCDLLHDLALLARFGPFANGTCAYQFTESGRELAKFLATIR
jgi:hypothetical protein